MPDDDNLYGRLPTDPLDDDEQDDLLGRASESDEDNQPKHGAKVYDSDDADPDSLLRRLGSYRATCLLDQIEACWLDESTPSEVRRDWAIDLFDDLSDVVGIYVLEVFTPTGAIPRPEGDVRQRW